MCEAGGSHRTAGRAADTGNIGYLGDRGGRGSLLAIEASITLARGPASPKRARDFVAEAVDCSVDLDVLDVIILLTSEVVTNAVLHARTEARLKVVVGRAAVRVEVIDGERREPVPRRAAVDDTSGRGLQLVDALSSRWGVEALRAGKRVWFEVDR